MRLYIYIYISFIKRLPLRLNEYPNTVNGEIPVSLNKVGPTCYSQCDLVVFFLIRSCPYHYCVYSVVRHYSYICQFFPLAFFILFCRSLLLLFLWWGLMFNSTRHSLFCSHSSYDYSVPRLFHVYYSVTYSSSALCLYM